MLSSMTGFARAAGSRGVWRWSVELKCVNAKGLDVRLRVPPVLDRIEAEARQRLSRALARGTCFATIDVKREGASRVTWEISPVEDSCRLVVTHDELRQGANEQLYGGWPMILSGLKTWLETGELLTTPGSLLYGR